ncbi:uncharacterized protein LOC123448000 isoform X2 [Hordeum vulgare subsp. vulgare]|uniref:uncharacterized protein LOC123448000 isoform X2 n=1 Tax=Hordeum vulgare subsp. vulgare TaxID=112509 RepID=UPI001D1A3CD7|nr:uncharacterized protein LOC123448000 isoform X2 [Hordeum vulgare subsp. vulgare]
MRETVLTRFCLKKGERVTHALIVSLVQLWITVAARPPLVDSGQHRFSAAAELFAGIPSLPSASSTAPIHRAPLPRTAPANARRCGRRRVLGATPLLSPFLCSFFSHFSQPMPPSRRSPPALLLELLRRLHRIRLLPRRRLPRSPLALPELPSPIWGMGKDDHCHPQGAQKRSINDN